MKLTVEEALERCERMKHEWVILAYKNRQLEEPTYMCPQCWQQTITLVTPGARLPEECPRCKAKLGAPT
jgi:rubrerythrin